MKVEQVSIFLENKSGRLAEMTGPLAAADVNIRALSLADTTDFGILRLIVDKNERAKQTLKANGFTVGKTEVIAVEVPDRPRGLARILRTLDAARLNVEYVYAFVRRSGDNAILIFRFDDLDHAIQALVGAGVRVLTGEQVYAPCDGCRGGAGIGPSRRSPHRWRRPHAVERSGWTARHAGVSVRSAGGAPACGFGGFSGPWRAGHAGGRSTSSRDAASLITLLNHCAISARSFWLRSCSALRRAISSRSCCPSRCNRSFCSRVASVVALSAS